MFTYFQPRRKRHFAPIIGAVTYLGAVAHDIVGHIENPFMDTFRDRDGNINIHGDRDNSANLNGNCNGDCRMQGNANGNFQGNQHGDTDVKLQGKLDSNINAKLNGNVGLNLNLHFGLRRTNGEQGSHTIFVPIDELTDVDNLSSFKVCRILYAKIIE